MSVSHSRSISDAVDDNHVWSLPAVIVLFVVGYAGVLFLPLYVSGAGAEFGLSDRVVGRLATIHLAGTAISATLLAAMIKRLDARKALAAGTSLTSIANFLPLAGLSLNWYAASQFLSGVGEGMILAIVHAALAHVRNPHRTILWCNFAVLAVGAAVYPGAGWLIEKHGLAGLLTAVGAVTAFATVACLAFPRRALSEGPERGLRVGGTRLVAVAVSAFYVGEGALWAYVGNIGLSKGLDVVQVSKVLSFAFILALGSPVVIWILDKWFERRQSLLVSLSALSGVTLIMCWSESPVVYVWSCYAFYVLFIIGVVYLTSAAAEVDKSGRLLAAVPALRTVGSAGGPLIIGSALGTTSYLLFAIVVCVFYALSAFCAHRATSPRSIGKYN